MNLQVGQFAALCIASGVRGQELWTGFLAGMELNQEAMVRDAQATLTALMSMHALDATGPAVAYVLPGDKLADAAPIAINSAGAGAALGGAGAAAGGAGAAPAAGEAAAPGASVFSGSTTLSSGAVPTSSASAGPKDESVTDL